MRIRFSGILKTIILCFVLIFQPSIFLSGQVVVERSKDKVIISGKSYYIHIVKKGETAYSIARAYNISVDELITENPVASKGLNTGQSLRLPIRDLPAEKPVQPPAQTPARDELKFTYHRLIQGETVYSLSKRYGVTEAEILKSNPGVEIHKLPVGAEIAIPKMQEPVQLPPPAGQQQVARPATETETRVQEQPAKPAVINEEVQPQTGKQYISHKVVKGETIASIAEKYGLTVRELRKENKGMIFPKVDEYIRIPVERMAEVKPAEIPVADTAMVSEVPVTDEERAKGVTVVSDLSGKFNVAVLLPLYLKENARRSETDSSQVIKGKRIYRTINRPEQWIYPETVPFLEFYQGVLLAADTLRSLGMDVNLHIYDIRSDTAGVTQLIESGELRKMDLILGPVYSRNLVKVSEYAGRFDIPVVSPVPLRSTDVLGGNPNLFIVNPSLEVAQERIAGYVALHDTGNVIFIKSDTLIIDEKVDRFRTKLQESLTGSDTVASDRLQEFIFHSRSQAGLENVAKLEKMMSDSTLNIVLVASEEPAVLSEVIMDIHSLSKKYPVKLIGYPAMRDMENLEPKFYFELGTEVFTPSWIDYNSNDVKNYLSDYRSKFLTEPSLMSFAWLGYDITYYFLSGVSIHGRRFLNRPWIHNPDLLQTEFDFRQVADSSGFENRKLFLIRYSRNMEVELVSNENENVKKN